MAFETRLISGALILASAALIPSPSNAHHSFAMFDNSKEVVLNGTVREFQWTNPHSWIQLVVKVGGKSVEYSIEMQSPNSLKRLGWSKVSLKAGDKVKIKIHPLKTGTNGGSFMSATFPNGRVLDGQAAP
jgi:hypothetical protein